MKTTNLEDQFAALERERAELVEAHNQEKTMLEREKATLERENKRLIAKNSHKKKKLKKQELSKLAQAYHDQEKAYNKNRKWWFAITFILSYLAIATTVLIFRSASSSEWYEKFAASIYASILLTTLLVFILRQYSYYNKLRVDYANRKTIAQSYHHILTSVDDKTIKSKIIDKSADILFANSDVKVEPNTLPEKLIEQLAEIIKAVGSASGRT